MRADAAYWPFPEVRHLAESEVLMSLLRPLCPAVPFPVRAIYSDKSVETNWLVAWHQDLTIVVNQQAELACYGPWSVKNGPVHVQPPAEWLERMLTIRLHLDDADAATPASRFGKNDQPSTSPSVAFGICL